MDRGCLYLPSYSGIHRRTIVHKPIPYRPFRWGPSYHVTMGIRSMPWEEWIELDNKFASYHRIRVHRIETRGTDVLRILQDRPGIVRGAQDAVLELVQELAEYLAVRYPSTFRIERYTKCETNKIMKEGCGGELPVRLITIIPLGVTYALNEDANDMIRVSALLVVEYRMTWP